METLVRAQRASLKVAKVQRRIWLIQALFWPVIVIGGLLTAAAAARWAWNRRTASAESRDVVTPQPLGSDSTSARG
ncbi:hypothetical protein PT015_17905 [Candidatus Mycobacterium wuenschmannii]|uniref:Transmembrane protein n=1 Tax=Candidatus Mycobacterium wuenschmannii TaxID=3027808 RepID=A0ABY8VT01_9MYCO|nr:hypothetical protein [Candidatus Mycobacterium wuenschmannii]WIM86743.1 hypothetical protein PT015_17905 [Candidatus Mycobacterium wuenschmannii]